MSESIDFDLVAKTLRDHGHIVSHIIPVPENAGEYEFEVDGNILTLAETRSLLELEDEQRSKSPATPRSIAS